MSLSHLFFVLKPTISAVYNKTKSFVDVNLPVALLL